MSRTAAYGQRLGCGGRTRARGRVSSLVEEGGARDNEKAVRDVVFCVQFFTPSTKQRRHDNLFMVRENLHK